MYNFTQVAMVINYYLLWQEDSAKQLLLESEIFTCIYYNYSTTASLTARCSPMDSPAIPTTIEQVHAWESQWQTDASECLATQNRFGTLHQCVEKRVLSI